MVTDIRSLGPKLLLASASITWPKAKTNSEKIKSKRVDVLAASALCCFVQAIWRLDQFTINSACKAPAALMLLRMSIMS